MIKRSRFFVIPLFLLALIVLAQSGIAPVLAETDAVTNPILFVTQVPLYPDYTTVGSTIGNQSADMDAVPRGGDLYIRYTDGTLKNLTQTAGYGSTGANGFQDQNAIAVRDPAVYWDGTKAVFSMVVARRVNNTTINHIFGSCMKFQAGQKRNARDYQGGEPARQLQQYQSHLRHR